MTNIYNAIQNLYNMDKETWQEVLSEMYTLVNNTSLKFDTFEQKFLLHLGNEVTKELKKMYDDGRLGDLINDVLLNDINTKVDNNYTTLDNKIDTVNSELNSQLEHITNKTNLIINVKDFGVLGDGTTNDTNNLIKVFAFAQENELLSKTIIFPKGVYLVNGESISSSNSEYGRLRVPSNTIIDLCGSEIKMVQNNKTSSSIFRIINKENVVIKNGVFHGDFDNGNYVLGEWSFGVSAQDSKNIVVENSSFYNFRGDGIYFSYVGDTENANDNILIKNCLVDTVHRNGISITRGKNVIIDGCTIMNTTGNSLGAGIDIEPDHDIEDEYVQHLVLSNNKFYNIKGSALRIQYCKNAKVYNNTVLDSLTPVETREAYDIEIYDNYFDRISGVRCSGYNLGNIVVRNNTIINFADKNLSGYVSSNILLEHRDKGGNGKIIFKDNIIRNVTIGNCMYIIDGNVDIIRNTIDTIPGEFVRTVGTSNVNIFDNTLSNFPGAAFSIIRARENSYITIKNNTFDTPINIIIANNDNGAHNTDIQSYQPNVGAYTAGQFVRNGDLSNISTMGWLCTSTGDFSTDTPPTFIKIMYPE